MFCRLFFLTLLLILLGSMTACQPTTYNTSPPTIYGDGVSGGVDTRFREFHNVHGGKDLLGIAISPKFLRNSTEYQYTAAALMAYNPLAERSRQYYFAPIGVELGIAEPPTDPGEPGGHKIYPGFVDTYERLGGARLVGLPLTDVRYNEERGGVEQYFENLGFFQLESEPGVVRLLHYGAWMCTDVCNFQLEPVFNPLLFEVVQAPFATAVSRVGPAFTGKPLNEPFIAPDGLTEQIFENVVVVEASSRPGGIALRPITAMLGVPVQPGANFEIPGHFMEFLNQYSGLELSGPAVTEYSRQSDELYRQCFANLCLDYFPNKAEELQVRPTPLGYLYKDRYYQGGEVAPAPASEQSVTLNIFKGYSVVAPNQSQIITVIVYEGDQAVVNAQPALYLMLPGGDTRSYDFPPAQSNGRTSLQLEPISAAHGTRVDYRVCYGQVCLDDYFLIWGNP